MSAPNAYAVAAPKDSPAYSLAARSKEQKRYITPAPGNYEVRHGKKIYKIIPVTLWKKAALIKVCQYQGPAINAFSD